MFENSRDKVKEKKNLVNIFILLYLILYFIIY